MSKERTRYTYDTNGNARDVSEEDEVQFKEQATAALVAFTQRVRAQYPKEPETKEPTVVYVDSVIQREQPVPKRKPTEDEPRPTTATPSECLCEDAIDIVDAYAIPDPFNVAGATLTVSRTDSRCYWCGWSNGADDERQKFELFLSEDIDGHGTCGWSLFIHDGDVQLTKAWDDGSPVGTYSSVDEGSTTVEEGVGTVNNPC